MSWCDDQPPLHSVSAVKRYVVASFCEVSHFRDHHDEMLENGLLDLLVSQARVNDSMVRRQCSQVWTLESCTSFEKPLTFCVFRQSIT